MTRLTLVPLAAALLLLAGCGAKSDGSVAQADAAKPVAPPAGTTWVDNVAATPEGGMRMGNPDAPIKLVEYGSLSCPHCAKLAQDGYAKLTETYVASGRVSYEFRSFVIHPQDVPLTVLAQCSTPQAFFPLVDQVFANFDAMQAPLSNESVVQRANAAMQGPPDQRLIGLSDALGFTEFFSARGVPVAAARACLADTAKAKQIADNTQKWSAEGVNSTPTLVINGTKLETNEWTGLEAALKEAGAR